MLDSRESLITIAEAKEAIFTEDSGEYTFLYYQLFSKYIKEKVHCYLMDLAEYITIEQF